MDTKCWCWFFHGVGFSRNLTPAHGVLFRQLTSVQVGECYENKNLSESGLNFNLKTVNFNQFSIGTATPFLGYRV